MYIYIYAFCPEDQQRRFMGIYLAAARRALAPPLNKFRGSQAPSSVAAPRFPASLRRSYAAKYFSARFDAPAEKRSRSIRSNRTIRLGRATPFSVRDEATRENRRSESQLSFAIRPADVIRERRVGRSCIEKFQFVRSSELA